MSESEFAKAISFLENALLIRHGDYNRSKEKNLNTTGELEMTTLATNVGNRLGTIKDWLLLCSPVSRAMQSADIVQNVLTDKYDFNINREKIELLKLNSYVFKPKFVAEFADLTKAYKNVLLLTHQPNIEILFPHFEEDGFEQLEELPTGNAYHFDYVNRQTLVLPVETQLLKPKVYSAKEPILNEKGYYILDL